jgi:hypothetical protein
MLAPRVSTVGALLHHAALARHSLVPDPLDEDHHSRGRDEDVEAGDCAMLMLDGKEAKPKQAKPDCHKGRASRKLC